MIHWARLTTESVPSRKQSPKNVMRVTPPDLARAPQRTVQPIVIAIPEPAPLGQKRLHRQITKKQAKAPPRTVPRPAGSNDDIVARRLRKAAEQETDPELKEKLWKEYIEYKKNNG